MKKLFISIFTCVFALFALGTSTFAWFSMSKQANVEGIFYSVDIESDLLIANFEDVKTTGGVFADTAAYKTSIKAKDTSTTSLKNASSSDAENFWVAAGSVNGKGEAEANASGDLYSKVTTNPTEGSKYYAVHEFVVKYSNPNDVAENVILSKLAAEYVPASGENSESAQALAKAVRIGIITSGYDYTANATTATDKEVSDKALEGIYAISGATYFEHANETKGGANSATTVAAITAGDGVIYSCPKNSTSYFKVTVVLWIEGEDTSCLNSVYSLLKGTWQLSFELCKQGTTDKTPQTVITPSTKSTTTD